MLIKQSLSAGLITGLGMAFLVFLIYFLWDQLQVVWPVAFVPLFATGVYAVHRAGPAVAGAGRAALAGSLGGLAAAAVSLLAVVLVSILAAPGAPLPYPMWNLAMVLLDKPLPIPLGTFYYDLPSTLPFPWPINLTTPQGVLISRIPWTLILWIPAGIVLAALQGWLHYVLARDMDVGVRAAGPIARMRARFQNKLLVGFVLLSVMIFAVGWLGWASTEEMHLKFHQGRTMRHWLDHTTQLQANLRAQTEALSRLSRGPEPAALPEVTALGEKIATELTHLKAFPPPSHPVSTYGVLGGRNYLWEAEKRLPAVREVDSRFGDLNKAAARVVELQVGGNAAEARELLSSLPPLQQAVEGPLQELASDLSADLGAWMAAADDASHEQLWSMVLLVLLATGLAFPLGYVFSQVVVRPVQEVGKGLERIGSGEFASRVQVENQDELGDLAQQVNQMGGELDRLYAELRGLNDNLQQKVEEQLQEIEHARVLKRYLSPQVADSIIAGQGDVKLATTRKNLTVCFSDIRGFTGLSERMEPEELIDLLNNYFSVMTDIIFQYGGTLDKYLGDGIMIFIGDPIPYEDHEARAVSMALDMRLKLAEFQRQWFVDRQETLNIGIGISTGYVTVGNIGSSARLEYTVIGNHVNLAARLADMAAPGQILICERTLVRVRDLVQAREVGEVMVEGSARPVHIYEVLERMSDDIFALRRPL